MKLSELKLNDRAKLISTKVNDYEFVGAVENSNEFNGELWIVNKNRHGYKIDKKYDDLWEVELLN